jgi:phospholipase/lecithinase/hemolysin
LLARRTLIGAAIAAPFVTRGKAETMLPYSRFVVFGDGLSDQGRWGPLTRFRYPPSPPFAKGRWTGGPTWVEHLSRLSGVPLAAADNHAMGGAITGWWNINEPLRSALGPAFDIPLPGVLGQAEAALAVGAADLKALYILWAGGHHEAAGKIEGRRQAAVRHPHPEIFRGRAGAGVRQRECPA